MVQIEVRSYHDKLQKMLNLVAVVVVHVLDDLIHSDKLVSGSLKLEQHLVDIRKLISTCTALYVDEAQAKGVFLAHDSVESQAEASYHGNEETGKLYLLGDQDKLEQVLNILIHRGINYTPLRRNCEHKR